MTRKDYVIIAGVLNTIYQQEWSQWDLEDLFDTVVDRLADALTADNPRFDRARFLSATFRR